jgi:competence protein ComEA
MTRKLFCSVILVVFACASGQLARAQTPTAQPTPPSSQASASKAAPARPRPSGKTARATTAAPVNLNTATAADLETLPGIGQATAARILEYRQKSGGFKKIEDLMNVKGIGEKTFLKLKPLVTLTTRAGLQ